VGFEQEQKACGQNHLWDDGRVTKYGRWTG
jgi:hypothetical protein